MPTLRRRPWPGRCKPRRRSSSPTRRACSATATTPPRFCRGSPSKNAGPSSPPASLREAWFPRSRPASKPWRPERSPPSSLMAANRSRFWTSFSTTHSPVPKSRGQRTEGRSQFSDLWRLFSDFCPLIPMTMTDAYSSDQIIALAKKHLIGNYTRYPVYLVRGEGSWVWDAEGKRYLDFFPGWGCGILGHCPPRVVEAVREQVATLIHVPNTWYTEPQVLLAKALSERTDFGGQCFFCNSGTEAVEAAIKLARLNGRAKNRYKLITTTGSFHGRTMGALTATAQPTSDGELQRQLATL